MSDDVRDTVARLEERRWTALTDSDLATLRELLADEMIYTHSNAQVDTKESYLGAIEDGRVAYKAVARSEEQIRTFGSTAVVTGHAVMDAEAGGRLLQIIARYSAVWAHQEGAWRFVCWQSTPVSR